MVVHFCWNELWIHPLVAIRTNKVSGFSSSYGKPVGTRVPSWGMGSFSNLRGSWKSLPYYKTWLLLMANASTNASFTDWLGNISRNHIHLKESNHPKPLISTTMDELWFIVSMFGDQIPAGTESSHTLGTAALGFSSTLEWRRSTRCLLGCNNNSNQGM